MTFRTLLTGVLSLGFGLLFPAYGSFTAIESSGTEDDTQWLVYWLLYSLLQGFEKFAWPVLQWIPLYGEVRVAVLIWLVLPQTKGATWMYEAVVGPLFSRILNEAVKIPAIDRMVNQTDSNSGRGQGQGRGAGGSTDFGSKIQSTLQNVGSTLQQSASKIQSGNPTQQRRAEARLNKDLQKIDNISSYHSKSG